MPTLALGVVYRFRYDQGMSTSSTALRQARLQAGLTQRALAELVGVRQPHIARWETGAQLPRVDTAVRIAVALDTRVETLWPPPTDKGAGAAATARPVTTSEDPDAAAAP